MHIYMYISIFYWLIKSLDVDICITPKTNKYLSTTNNNISQLLNAELIDVLLNNVFVDHSMFLR